MRFTGARGRRTMTHTGLDQAVDRRCSGSSLRPADGPRRRPRGKRAAAVVRAVSGGRGEVLPGQGTVSRRSGGSGICSSGPLRQARRAKADRRSVAASW
jgi:hypothetical protein